MLQKLIKDQTHRPHLAIWLTAALFALFHFSFGYVLALLVMGALLGYLKEWTGNLWLPILGHFVNNSLVLFVTYFFPSMMEEMDDVQFKPIWFFVSSIAVTFLCFVLYRKYRKVN